jgi:hypothetical protein
MTDRELLNDHEHDWSGPETVHDNADRTRVYVDCKHCDGVRHAVKAKRLDADGVELWGPVDGKWHYSYFRRGSDGG